MENINKLIPTYTKKILKFTNNKKKYYDNTSIINITICDDILTETEHKTNIRIIDNDIKQILPIVDNSLNIINNEYEDTLRKRSYVKISKTNFTSDSEIYAIFIYHILGISHVLIQIKYHTNDKSLLIYETTNRIPIDIISDAIETEKLAHKIVIEQLHEDKIISKSYTLKIINALNSNDPNTHPVFTIPLTTILNPILLNFYYTVLNKTYISKTPDDILSRLVWIMLNL